MFVSILWLFDAKIQDCFMTEWKRKQKGGFVSGFLVVDNIVLMMKGYLLMKTEIGTKENTSRKYAV